MKDKTDLTIGWFRKGQSDLNAAQRILESDGPYDTACFHAQQAAEKFLKAFLAFNEQPIPRTHDLEELAQLCISVNPLPELQSLDLESLSDYAVEIRYDFESWPSLEIAQEASQKAEKIGQVMLSYLPASIRSSLAKTKTF